MEVKRSDGAMEKKAENIFKSYEKTVDVFTIWGLSFFTTVNLRDRRINEFYFAKSSTYISDVVWYFILLIIDCWIEQTILCMDQ